MGLLSPRYRFDSCIGCQLIKEGITMDNEALVDGLVKTVKDAYHKADHDIDFEVRAVIKAMLDKALLDDDSEESLLFNGVYIACDEYSICSQAVKLEYAERVVAAVRRCRVHLYNTTVATEEETKVIKAKALEIVTKAIEAIDDNPYQISSWYDLIHDETSDPAVRDVMENEKHHSTIDGLVSEYFGLALELLKQHIKEA